MGFVLRAEATNEKPAPLPFLSESSIPKEEEEKKGHFNHSIPIHRDIDLYEI